MNGVEKIAFADDTSKMLASLAHASGADFDGDGHGDILWQHDDGRAAMWLMNGLSTGTANVIDAGLHVPSSWTIWGAGDFNGDGHADILWRNDDGRPAIWEMNGLTTGNANVVDGGVVVQSAWTVAGVGDFNGDGRADILWHHDDGRAAIWIMNGLNTQAANVTVGAQITDASDIVGTGDFDGDGKTDILWRNDDGRPAIWLMNGLETLHADVIDGGSVPNDCLMI